VPYGRARERGAREGESDSVVEQHSLPPSLPPMVPCGMEGHRSGSDRRLHNPKGGSPHTRYPLRRTAGEPRLLSLALPCLAFWASVSLRLSLSLGVVLG